MSFHLGVMLSLTCMLKSLKTSGFIEVVTVAVDHFNKMGSSTFLSSIGSCGSNCCELGFSYIFVFHFDFLFVSVGRVFFVVFFKCRTL